MTPASNTISARAALDELASQRADARVHSGRLIVVEGRDGAGKTDLVSGLAAALRAEGRDVINLREPGGTPLGEQIRSILKDPASVIGDRAEALLFAAARAQLIEQVVKPSLERGDWVIVDRFIPSSVIYQGIARGLGIEDVAALSEFAVDGIKPDLILALQIDAQVAAQRMRERDGDTGDRIEETIDMTQIVEGYRTITDREPRAVNVDANGSREQTVANALAALAGMR